MQYPVIGYIDGSSLVRVTLSQTAECRSFDDACFAITDEHDSPVEIIALEAKPRNLYLTGDFFDWKVQPEGKLHWNKNDQYYFCDLPRSRVMGKQFKFIENSYLWYPAEANLVVNEEPGAFLAKGYIFCDEKVRFILKHNTFGFRSIELELHTKTSLLPDIMYYLTFQKHNRIALINRDIFNQREYYYSGDDLGFTWSMQATVFRLWSPVADKMSLLLFQDAGSKQPYQKIEMSRAEKGVWIAEVPGNWENYYYLYEITIDGATWQQIDPYSRALATNSTRSLIFDKAKTDPHGWKEQKQPFLDSPADAVIYELHIRDFSIAESWQGNELYRGKYLGLTWSGELQLEDKKVVIGLAHLKELGVNVIQLLPVFDFNTVDETGKDPAKLRNWGYDPYAYNVPEGSYATNPADASRLLEFKEMVMHLHNNGFKVVMDVVYNHTANVGAPFSVFDTFMPEYFYRMDRAGHYTNGSGCGNEIASEKVMVRKYILDSLRYWTQEFQIDGFRFDLMGLIDLKTMQMVVKELKKLKKDILIYGEPWAGGASPLKKPAIKGTQKNKGFAVFNDDFRDSLRGDTDGIAKGWAMGANALKDEVIKGIFGSIDNFTAQPTETINYVSAHDNYTWYDKLLRSTPEVDEETRHKMAKLGLAIVITSQGVPFLTAGSEFLRTKRVPGVPEEDIRNSYRAGDEVNQIDWARKAAYYEFFQYIKRLLEIRKNYQAFRLPTAAEIRDRIFLITDGVPPEVIAYLISGKNIETDLLIIHNPQLLPVNIKLPEGIWKIIFDDEFEQRKQQATHIDKEITVSPISTTILELD
ncbi:MAG: type I pullulanase [Candidatus Cloacimonetes bacterium]|nr:type I pullulanase [Candidatus Cloacimonadota bacterium]